MPTARLELTQLFPRPLLTRVQPPGLHKNMPTARLEPTQFVPNATANTRSTAYANPADSKNGTVQSTDPYTSGTAG